MESNYNKFVKEYVKLMEQTKKEEEEIKIQKKKKIINLKKKKNTIINQSLYTNNS